MTNALALTDNSMMQLLHQGQMENPFAEEILLTDALVAGIHPIPRVLAKVEQLRQGQELTLKRQTGPSNPFEIDVMADDIRIGFIPRSLQVIFSRLIDAQKRIICRVVQAKTYDTELQKPPYACVLVQLILKD